MPGNYDFLNGVTLRGVGAFRSRSFRKSVYASRDVNQRGDQFGCSDRFRDKSIRPLPSGEDRSRKFVDCQEHNSCLVHLSNSRGSRNTIHSGHVDVEKYDIRS